MVAKPRDDVGTVQALYSKSACAVPRCGSTAIAWVPTAKKHPRTGARVGSGAPIPLDYGRDPDGLLVQDRDPRTGLWQARPIDAGDDPGRPRYTAHWTTCHTPALYQQVKGRADPMGVFPPLRTRLTGREGPCTRCGQTHPNRFGPVACPLCPTCSAIAVAGWSPAFRRLMNVDDLPAVE